MELSFFVWILCKKLSPAGQRGSIQDFCPGGLCVRRGNWKPVCILISFGEEIQSKYPELWSGSDECVAEPSHDDNQ